MSRADVLFDLYVQWGNEGCPIEFFKADNHPEPLANNVTGFTLQALEDLEKAGSLTLRRDGDRVIVTSLTVPEHLKIAFEKHPLFWSIRGRVSE